MLDRNEEILFTGPDSRANHNAVRKAVHAGRIREDVVNGLLRLSEEKLLEGSDGEGNRDVFVRSTEAGRDPISVAESLIRLNEEQLLSGSKGVTTRDIFVKATVNGQSPMSVADKIIEPSAKQKRAVVHVIAQGSRYSESPFAKLPPELLGRIATGFFKSSQEQLTTKIEDINNKMNLIQRVQSVQSQQRNYHDTTSTEHQVPTKKSSSGCTIS
jgi:hypothetical protein